MGRIHVHQDVRPLTEFRKNMARMVQQMQESRRPLILTQHGRCVAVVLSPAEYDELVYRHEFIQAVGEGEGETEAGEVTPQTEVKDEFRKVAKAYRARNA